MNKTTIVAVLTAMLAPLALASHTPTGGCDSDGTPALGIIQVNTVAGGSGLHGPNPDGAFYVDDRNYVLGNGIWIYEESNEIYSASNDAAHNLQRGGASPYVPDDSEICVDDPNVVADTVIL